MVSDGAPASGTGSTRSAPEAPAGLRPSGDDPSRTDIEAEEAEKFGIRFWAIQMADGCSSMVCTFPHDGNCFCFNRALAEHTASAIEARRAAALDAVHESAVGESRDAQVIEISSKDQGNG